MHGICRTCLKHACIGPVRFLLAAIMISVTLPSMGQSATDSVVMSSPSRQRLLSLRTNLVHDFLAVPNFGFVPMGNIQVELFPRRGHLSLNLGTSYAHYHHKSRHKFFEIRDFQVEVRRYFHGHGTFSGPFLGLYAEDVRYDFGLNGSKGWQGSGGGGGLTFGHTMRLNRSGSFRLELTMSLGFLATHQDRYVYGNPKTGEDDGKYYYDYHGELSEFKRRSDHFTWFGPTNLGVQLTYDIIYHKRKGGRQ